MGTARNQHRYAIRLCVSSTCLWAVSVLCDNLQQLARKRPTATQLLPRFNNQEPVLMLTRCKGSIRFATIKGNELLLQVNSVHVNPVDSNLMVSSSNDWTVRLNDVRMLSAAASDSKGVYFEMMSKTFKPIVDIFCLLIF